MVEELDLGVGLNRLEARTLDEVSLYDVIITNDGFIKGD